MEDYIQTYVYLLTLLLNSEQISFCGQIKLKRGVLFFAIHIINIFWVFYLEQIWYVHDSLIRVFWAFKYKYQMKPEISVIPLKRARDGGGALP